MALNFNASKCKGGHAYFLLFMLLSVSFSSFVHAQCACCAGAGMGASGDPSLSISMPAKRQFVLEGAVDYRSVHAGAMHHHGMMMSETPLRSMLVNSLALRYGISDRFAVSVQQPYLLIQTSLGNDKGFGDMQLISTYGLLRNNRLNLSLNAGLELPLGIQKEASFEQSTAVIGSGSFDPIMGMSANYKIRRFVLGASAFYKKTTNGFQNNNYGSSALQSAVLSYALLGNKADCTADSVKQKNPLALSIHAAYLGEWLDKLVEDDVVDENSGYYIGYASAGLTASYGKWSLPITLAIPAFCNMNGMQNNPSLRLRLSIVRSF